MYISMTSTNIIVYSKSAQKTVPFLYFLEDFNDSYIILKRIVSHHQISIEIRPLQLERHHFQQCIMKNGFCLVNFDYFQWFARHFHEDCLTNSNLFSSREDDSSCFFLGGPHSHCLLYDSISKSTLKAAMSYKTYTRWIAWKKSKMQ